MVWLGFASGGSGWMAGSGVISPFQVSSPLLFLLILILDWGKIHNQYLRQANGGVGCRNQLQLYLSATWAGRSLDPFRDVRLTSLSLLFPAVLPVPFHAPEMGASGFMPARLLRQKGFGLSVTRERGRGEGRKRNFCFASEGEKVPKMGLFVT